MQGTRPADSLLNTQQDRVDQCSDTEYVHMFGKGLDVNRSRRPLSDIAASMSMQHAEQRSNLSKVLEEFRLQSGRRTEESQNGCEGGADGSLAEEGGQQQWALSEWLKPCSLHNQVSTALATFLASKGVHGSGQILTFLQYLARERTHDEIRSAFEAMLCQGAVQLLADQLAQRLLELPKPQSSDASSLRSKLSAGCSIPELALGERSDLQKGRDERVSPPASEAPPGEAEAASVWDALERSHGGVREVRLVRASWLAKQWAAKEKTPLARRQDLEADPQTAAAAFLEVDELRALPRGPEGQLPIVAVSHAWEAKEHPDPEGATLRALCARLARERDEANARRRGGAPLPSEVGVFLDWCSLCQQGKGGSRSEAEEEAFRGARESMELWYAHPLTTVLKLSEVRSSGHSTPYAERGWPTFESHAATLAKRSSDKCWTLVMEVGEQSHRRPPLTVGQFAQELAAKRFADDDDKERVLELYRRALHTYFAPSRSLQLSGLRWGDADATQLARTLPQCNRLESLELAGNAFGNDGVRTLATALHKHCAALTHLSLSGKIGAAGVEALLPLCKARPSLRLAMDGVALDDDYSPLTYVAARGDAALAQHVLPALERGGASPADTDACGRTPRLAAAMAGREAPAVQLSEEARSTGALVLDVGTGESKLYALVPTASGVAVHELCKLGKLGRHDGDGDDGAVAKLRKALVEAAAAFPDVRFDRSMLGATAWYRALEPDKQRKSRAKLEAVASSLQAPLAALGAPPMEVHEVAPTMEALYEHAATAHAAARCGLDPPVVVLSAGQGSMQVSGYDTAFSIVAPLARGEALVKEGNVDAWRHYIALEGGMVSSPLPEHVLREAGRENKPLHVVLVSGFWYAARAALREGVYVDVEEVRNAAPPAAPKDVANWERLLVLLWQLFADRPVRCLFARDWQLPDGAPFRATWAAGWWLSGGASPSHGKWRTPVPRWTASTAREFGWEGSRVAWRDTQWRTATLAAERGKARCDGAQETSALPEASESPVVWLPAARVHLPAGERLVVAHDGRLRDATVERWLGLEAGNAHELRLDDDGGGVVRVDLHERNHARARLRAAAFKEARREYLTQVCEEFAFVEDAITGNVLNVEKQMLHLSLVTEETTSGWTAPATVKDLAARLHEVNTPPVLLCAGPGTGKTWSVKQSMWQMATSLLKADSWLVPVVVPVQELARMGSTVTETHSILAYLRHKYEKKKDGRFLRLLEQAFEMRAVVLLIDGVDEAAALRVMIEELVVCSLAPRGFRVLVTSRPEGVQKGLAAGWYSAFVRLNLRELTVDDRQRVLEQQGVHNEMYKKLCAFRDIRDKHDELYSRLFPAKERRALQALSFPDRLYPSPPTRDPMMRQHSVAGVLIARREGAPKSETVRKLTRGVFSPEGLLAIDAAAPVATPPHDAEGSVASAHDALAREVGLAVGRELADKEAKMCRKLADLAAKRDNTPASKLWPEIAARVDELYEASEAAWPAFQELLDKLEAGPGVKVVRGDLKDPVRVHEKAMDDYDTAAERAEGELPEACVLDLLRARLVVSDVSVLAKATEWLKDAAHETGGTLEVMRLKNKFAALDPAHFRNLLINARLKRGDVTAYVELQLHHEEVLKLNDAYHCHDLYNFFRAKLCGQYAHKLDAMLEKTMTTFAEVSKNPVLLSLLVVLLGDGDDALSVHDRYSLYKKAMARVISRDTPAGEPHEGVHAMLRAVACANHLREEGEGVRFFRDAEVRAALTKEQWALWRLLLRDKGGVPLVQVLTEAREGGDDGEYQFKHLSFQEALVAQAVVEGDEGVRDRFWKDDLVAATRVRAFYRNTLAIGGGHLCEALFKHRARWDFSMADSLSADDVKALATLALAAPPQDATVRLKEKELAVASLLHQDEVYLGGCGLRKNDSILVAHAVHTSSRLITLDLNSEPPLRCHDRYATHPTALRPSLALPLTHTQNNIGGEGAAHIAEALKTNATLTSLNLDGAPPLRRRDRHATHPTALRPCLALPLSHTHNYIGGEGAAHIAEALKTNATLTSLHLDGAPPLRRRDRRATHPTALRPCLAHPLSHTRTNIGGEGAAHIAEALKTNATLTSLHLHNSNIGGEGAAHIAEALKTNATLTSLHLEGNEIGDEGAAHIAEALKTNATLTSLNLRGAPPLRRRDRHATRPTALRPCLALHLSHTRNKIGDEGAAHIAEALKTNATLTSLHLTSNNIGAEGAAHIAETLKTNTTLTSLNLRDNRIGDEGAAHIAETLKTNATLTSLNLRDNRIGDEGAAHIAETLKTNTTLTSLHLHNNRIGAEGAAHIAEALKTNATLTSLHLDDNRIGGEGAAHIAEALKTNATLTSLHLDENNIGAEGAAHIAEALKTNATLTSLHLDGAPPLRRRDRHATHPTALRHCPALPLSHTQNNIGAEGAAHIAEALKTNTSLTSLNLRGTNIGAEGAAHIAEVLKTNATLTSLNLDGAPPLRRRDRHATHPTALRPCLALPLSHTRQ
ncbi:hypothetical protein AB1Y20_005683 [Prymnesium parvum]|uniref:NACHT domain-containing protein n=1 Tax=Prymnesium parvum TaxID=97485 RepID=A0AB34J413_PRYPA